MPLSRSAIDRLGERLRTGGSPEDHELLTQFRDAHVGPLENMKTLLVRQLRDGPPHYDLSARVKTVPTLIEKLQREGNMALHQMQDIAGVRIVITEGRTAQDATVRLVEDAFHTIAPTGKVRVVDRREKPSHGYRAVHVIAKHADIFVEVQVRTELQHL